MVIKMTTEETRKNLDFLIAVAGSQVGLATVLGVSAQNIRDWHNRGRVPLYGALLIRATISNLLPGHIPAPGEWRPETPASYWDRALRGPTFGEAIARALKYHGTAEYYKSRLYQFSAALNTSLVRPDPKTAN